MRWLLAALLAPRHRADAAGRELLSGKTINLIIGYPPAGANDVYARLVWPTHCRAICGPPTSP
jgi:hypothetical protein